MAISEYSFYLRDPFTSTTIVLSLSGDVKSFASRFTRFICAADTLKCKAAELDGIANKILNKKINFFTDEKYSLSLSYPFKNEELTVNIEEQVNQSGLAVAEIFFCAASELRCRAIELKDQADRIKEAYR